jgi:sugar phosphate permease
MAMASAIPFIAEEFHFSPLVMGEVLSAFFAGYTLMQFPGGLLADRFGPKAVLAASIAGWSILTALTGMARGLTSLLVIQVLSGFVVGPFPSAVSKTLSSWFPERELARVNGLVLASTAIGATVAPLLVASLTTGWGWRSVFYVLFLPGVPLAIVVWRYVPNSPAQSRHLLPQELMEYDGAVLQQSPAKVDIWRPLRTPAVLWCALCMLFVNMVSWGLMNWLPTYLLQARRFSIGKMGLFAALANLAGAFGYPLGGYICDKFFRQKLRIPIMLGMTATGLFVYLAAVATKGEWAVGYFLAVFLCLNAASTGICTLPLVVVPKSAVGGAFGIVNTAGQLAGLLSPVLVGYVLNMSQGNFKVALYGLVGLALIAMFPASRIRQTAAADLRQEPVVIET